MTTLRAIAPQFLVADLAAAVAHYRDCLGFGQRIAWGGFYASVVRDGVEIHLKCAPAPAGARAHQRAGGHLDAFVEVEDLDALHREFAARGARIVQPPTVQPWQGRDMLVEDLDGYRLVFAQPLRRAAAGGLHLRRATFDDYAAVEAVWRDQNRHHVALEPRHLQPVAMMNSPAQFQAALRDPDHAFVLAERAGQVIGAVWLEHRHAGGGAVRPADVAFIREICVREGARGAGVGAALLDAVLAWARERNLQRIDLNVWSRNHGAVRFYAAHGFRALRAEWVREG